MPSAATVIAGRAYVLIEAIDKTGRVLQTVGASLMRLKRFVPSLRTMLALMDKVSMKLRKIGMQLMQIGSMMQSKGMSILFRAGALAIPVVSSIRQYRDFSDAWLALRAVLDKTEQELAPLKKQILDLGATTSYMSTEIAEAAEELARAHFSVDEISDSLEHVLNLGRAGKVDLPVAARSMARIIRSFRMSAKEAPVVADQLFEASRQGVATVQELLSSLSFVAASANTMNMKLSETLGVLAHLANNMLVGTKGGTAFNNMLLRMGTKADEVKEKLGIDVFGDEGQLKEPVVLLTEIINKMRELSPKERFGLASIFNIRGFRAAVAMQNIEEIIQKIDAIEESSGKSAKAAKIMDSDVGGSLRRIQAAFNNFAIAWGSTFMKPIREFEDFIKPFLQDLGEWARKNEELSRKVLLLLVGMLALGAAFIALGIAVHVVGLAITGFGVLTAVVGGLISAFVALGPPLAVIFALFEALKMIWSPIGDALRRIQNIFLQTFTDIWHIAKNAFVAIKDLIMAGNVEGAMNVLLVSLQSIFDIGIIALKRAWLEFTFFFKKAFIEAIGGIKIAWAEIQNWLANKMLEFAEKSDFFNWLFKKISGVDIQAERERAKRLGNNPEMAHDILNEQLNDRRQEVIDEQNAKLAELTEETKKLREQYGKERETAKERADRAIKMAQIKPKERMDDLAGRMVTDLLPAGEEPGKTAKGVAAGKVEGLEFGTKEAVEKRYENEKRMVSGIERTADGVDKLVKLGKEKPDVEPV